MRHLRQTLPWVLIGLIGVLLVGWAFPRAFPILPLDWHLSRAEAKTIALERLRDLGEPVADPYIVIQINNDDTLERRLQLQSAEISPALLRDSELAARQVLWDVRVYAPRALPREWTYRALITLAGEVVSLRKRLQASEGEGSLADDEARRRASEYLQELGYELSTFAAQPEVRRDDIGGRTDLVVRFERSAAILGADFPYGVEVDFAGEELLGFGPWFDDPGEESLERIFGQSQIVFLSRNFLFTAVLLIVAVPFLRRYHDGQLGVRRGVQFLLLFLTAGLVFLILDAATVAEGTNIGNVDRQQTTWLIGSFIFSFQLVGLSVMAFMSWSVGESFCRECGWSAKLASLDAVFRGKWGNATVARSALRGWAVGLAMAGASLAIILLFQDRAAWPISSYIFDVHTGSPLPALSSLTVLLSFVAPMYLFACLLVPCWLQLRFGGAVGLMVALVASVLVLTPALIILPIKWGLPTWILGAMAPVLLFRFGDFLSSLLCGLTQSLVIAVLPMLHASDPWIQVNGWTIALLPAVPLLVSLRFLGTDHEFVYTYDDVPPHVRRIAERERQRVELETAARIQTSILPQLPEQLNGVEIAHTYLPASEVGGDFYDVLALEDGRLAVAVGDVAGHGVSSGLVMSMAKSALAVQVTFDPEVTSVFSTLNRMVYQSARQRLLTTLCYALIDPALREFYYSSAGHLFPYQVSLDGRVAALEAASYPLGVRGQLDVKVRTAKLDAGDTIFLYSDGLIEACPEGSEEPFGFGRLEESLERHAGKPPREMRDSVLADVETYTGHRRCDDDVTVLILRLAS